ncbi:hypothetical protein J4463_03300 [Candidatus Pacearchaeota archaeon]|nr:hypothetical protein [Candidatus Pacearchaeota archaeon]
MENEILILNKLEILKKELDYIKEHIEDITLTQEDLESIAEAKEDLSKGKIKRL